MRLKKNWEWLVSLFVVMTALATSIIFYFRTFNGSFSNKSSDWGAFGNYLSGTAGVVIALLAVIWLIYSVSIQKSEIKALKNELKNSAIEQERQTEISALSALIDSYGTAAQVTQLRLNGCNDGENHMPRGEDIYSTKLRLENEMNKMNELTKRLELKFLTPKPDGNG